MHSVTLSCLASVSYFFCQGKAPVKKIPTAPSTPVTNKNTAAVSNGKKKTSVNKEKEEAAVTAAAEEIAAAMEKKEEGSRTPVPKKTQNDLDADLPEFDPEKFTPGYVPKTVKKGDDEYMIVVQGVPDTGEHKICVCVKCDQSPLGPLSSKDCKCLTLVIL